MAKRTPIARLSTVYAIPATDGLDQLRAPARRHWPRLVEEAARLPARGEAIGGAGLDASVL